MFFSCFHPVCRDNPLAWLEISFFPCGVQSFLCLDALRLKNWSDGLVDAWISRGCNSVIISDTSSYGGAAKWLSGLPVIEAFVQPILQDYRRWNRPVPVPISLCKSNAVSVFCCPNKRADRQNLSGWEARVYAHKSPENVVLLGIKADKREHIEGGQWLPGTPSHSSTSNCNRDFSQPYVELTPHFPPHFYLKNLLFEGRVVSFGVTDCQSQSVTPVRGARNVVLEPLISVPARLQVRF